MHSESNNTVSLWQVCVYFSLKSLKKKRVSNVKQQIITFKGQISWKKVVTSLCFVLCRLLREHLKRELFKYFKARPIYLMWNWLGYDVFKKHLNLSLWQFVKSTWSYFSLSISQAPHNRGEHANDTQNNFFGISMGHCQRHQNLNGISFLLFFCLIRSLHLVHWLVL